MPQKQPWEPTWSEETGAWIIDFRVDGKRIRRRLPIHDRTLEAVALARAKEVYAELWRSATAKEQPQKVPTFQEASELYVESGGEARFLPRIVAHFGKKTRCNEIDEIGIARAARVLYPFAKPETVRRQLRVPIKAVLNFAAGNRREKLPDTRRTRWLTPEEAEQLLVAAANPQAAGLRDPNLETLRKIAFMLGTGAGPGETMGLDAKHWNPATSEWWLPGTKTVYRARFVRLPSRTVELISPIPEEGPAFPAPNGQPYVFRKNRGGQMAVAFGKVREAAGLGPEIVPYSCRHSWATWHAAQVKDWAALLDQGGWNRADTANRYRKVAPADLGHRLLAHGWDSEPTPASLSGSVNWSPCASTRNPDVQTLSARKTEAAPENLSAGVPVRTREARDARWLGGASKRRSCPDDSTRCSIENYTALRAPGISQGLESPAFRPVELRSP